MTAMQSPRIVLCECCGSEGRIYRGRYEDERDCGQCPACKGTGYEVIETEPIELEDLGTEVRAMSIPMKPGYYWAKWRIASDGTHEGEHLTPSDTWEIVQVNDNNVDDPADDEYLSVSVPGVRETQWRDDFVWGEFVAPLRVQR